MGTLASHGYLVGVLLGPEENALLRRLLLISGDAASVAGCGVDCESSVHVSASLVELDCLPSVLRRLADTRAILNSGCVCLLLVALS